MAKSMNLQKINIIKSDLYISKIYRVVGGRIFRSFIRGGHPRGSDGFIFILEGACRYTFEDGERFTAEQNQLLYLAAGALYDMEILSDKYAFVFVDFDFLSEEGRRSASYSLADPARVKMQFERLGAKYEKGRAGWQADCASTLYKIYAELVAAKEGYAAPNAKRLAYEAQTLFLGNLSSEACRVSLVAEKLKVSPTHLRRVFATTFGVSPIAFVRNARVARAVDLMTVSGISMEEIAEQCGFSSYPYFCRAFKEVTGKTPGKYR